MQENYDERKKEIEEEPDINHLHVGGGGEVVAHADEHGRQHQHAGEIHSNYSLKWAPTDMTILIK